MLANRPHLVCHDCYKKEIVKAVMTILQWLLFLPPSKMGATGGKHYLRTKKLSVTDRSCILADRSLTSIRQSSDQLTECVGTEIAASPFFRKRQKVRSTALNNALKELRSADALQLCCDGRFNTKSKVERCASWAIHQ